MKSVWQLVTAMQNRSDGLTLCEWTGHGVTAHCWAAIRNGNQYPQVLRAVLKDR
jgi:hypothetical protein